MDYINKIISKYPLNTFKGETKKELISALEEAYNEGSKTKEVDEISQLQKTIKEQLLKIRPNKKTFTLVDILLLYEIINTYNDDYGDEEKTTGEAMNDIWGLYCEWDLENDDLEKQQLNALKFISELIE